MSREWSEYNAEDAMGAVLDFHGRALQHIMERIQEAASEGALYVDIDYQFVEESDRFSRDEAWSALNGALRQRKFSVWYDRALLAYRIGWSSPENV